MFLPVCGLHFITKKKNTGTCLLRSSQYFVKSSVSNFGYYENDIFLNFLKTDSYRSMYVQKPFAVILSVIWKIRSIGFLIEKVIESYTAIHFTVSVTISAFSGECIYLIVFREMVITYTIIIKYF